MSVAEPRRYYEGRMQKSSTNCDVTLEIVLFSVLVESKNLALAGVVSALLLASYDQNQVTKNSCVLLLRHEHF